MKKTPLILKRNASNGVPPKDRGIFHLSVYFPCGIVQREKVLFEKFKHLGPFSDVAFFGLTHFLNIGERTMGLQGFPTTIPYILETTQHRLETVKFADAAG